MPDDLQDAIETNAQAPRRVVSDGVEAEQHPLPAQIAADRYLSSQTAAAASASRGLRFSKIKPGGAAP
ncbi:MAG TPA: hypothetical protein VM431_12995 [Phycisphaerae bacterium]|nr:hypothetical protein [Phycisphaerae bacterium]